MLCLILKINQRFETLAVTSTQGQDGVIRTRLTLHPESTKKIWTKHEKVVFKGLDIRQKGQ